MEDKALDALISLLDDADPSVYAHVEEKLLSLGETVVKPLESAWENSFDSLMQQRIEDLIHKIQLISIRESLQLWKLSGAFDLMQGLLIINKFQYPDLDEQHVINELEEIKREVWMQMIYDMSSVEKVRLINHTFYNTFGFKGNTKNFHDPQNSFLSDVLATRKGNPILLGSIYSLIAQKLDIPIYGVNLPQHFVLAYTDNYLTNSEENEVLFYINAFNRGQILGRHDVISFLKQVAMPIRPEFFKPCSNLDIVKRVLRNLVDAYGKSGAVERQDEAKSMLELLSE